MKSPPGRSRARRFLAPLRNEISTVFARSARVVAVREEERALGDARAGWVIVEHLARDVVRLEERVVARRRFRRRSAPHLGAAHSSFPVPTSPAVADAPRARDGHALVHVHALADAQAARVSRPNRDSRGCGRRGRRACAPDGQLTWSCGACRARTPPRRRGTCASEERRREWTRRRAREPTPSMAGLASMRNTMDSRSTCARERERDASARAQGGGKEADPTKRGDPGHPFAGERAPRTPTHPRPPPRHPECYATRST